MHFLISLQNLNIPYTMQTNLAMQQSVNPFVGLFDNRGKFDLNLSNATFIQVLENYEEFKHRTSPDYSIKSLRTNLEMVQVLAGHLIYPDEITDIFYATFSQWLTKKGVKYNSQKQYLSQIKTALEWGIRHKCPVSSTYDQFDLPKIDPYTIALSADEVSHIAHFNIDSIKCRSQHRRTLEKVRDHFVLSCNLGQRFSDMVRISPENFERNIFSCTQKKTGNRAKLDIDRCSITPSLVYKILEKYGYKAPWTGDITNYNHYLHELIRHIGEGFNEEKKIEYKIGGQIVLERKKKHELISSHTARRTFVTYNANRQSSIAEIMKATGHKSMSSFSTYIKFD